jgi:hypothetical protein
MEAGMRIKPAVLPVPSLESLESRLLLSAVNESALLAVPSMMASPPSVNMSALSSDWGIKRTASAGFGDEAGWTRDNAPTIAMNAAGAGTLNGAINFKGDKDCFTFVTPLSGTMQIALAPASGSPVDAELYLYDSAGRLVASNRPSNSRSAALSLSVMAGKRYYVMASASMGTVGAYVLGITTATPAPTPTPTPTPDPTPPPPAPSTLLPSASDYAPGGAVATQTRTVSGQSILVITGTDANDVITVSQSGGVYTISAAGGVQTVSGSFVGVALYGFGGADVLRLVNSVLGMGLIYSGDGNDQVFDAAQGADTVYGMGGDDLLVSVGGGADTLYGGAGLDSLWMDTSDTVSDIESVETAGKSVHRIASFFQPTSDASSRPSLEIAGQNLVDPLASYSYQNYANYSLFVDGPQYNDIRQGAVGDCYFLASLASLCDTDANIIRQMVAPMGDGTFAVRYFRSGQEIYVRVDADLPSLAYAKLSPANELWVAVVEKSYAQFRYGQNSYSSISGGWMATVYQEVTGVNATSASLSNMSDSALSSQIQQSLAAGHAMTAGSYSSPPAPIVGNHAYAVRSIESVGGVWYVTVYNPWGVDGQSWDSSNDGLLRLTLSQFRSCFSMLCASMA